MFVKKITFLVTITRNIHFGNVKALPNQQAATLVRSIRDVNQLYRPGEFIVEHALTSLKVISPTSA
jgi:hypothetical protein